MQSDFCEAWHLPSTNKDQKKLKYSFLIWIGYLSKECYIKLKKPLPRITNVAYIKKKTSVESKLEKKIIRKFIRKISIIIYYFKIPMCI